jgi:2-keto-4-pentenoate hydratase/2-oxohepta-3-ene-1,7-dioic acid hydratase in catechol pathway
MRLATVDHGGAAVVVAVTDDGVRDLSDLLSSPHTAVDPFVQIIEIIDDLNPGVIVAQPLIKDQPAFASLVPRPGKIVAAPVNYNDHQEEMKTAGDVSALGFLLKSPTSVLAHGGTVRLPYTDRRFDQEGELTLVIKKRARNSDPDDFLEYVAGFTCLLDITMRGGEDRSTRKSFDTFTPVGPYLVTPDEVGRLDDLTLRCSVNGVLRQDADISELIWGVPRFLGYASSVTTLGPETSSPPEPPRGWARSPQETSSRCRSIGSGR